MAVLKYIINENCHPILFSSCILHSHVDSKARSAGFVALNFSSEENKITVKCFGESTSLLLKSDEVEDTKIIDAFLNSKKV